MSGTGFVTNRRNRVSMRQWFDDGLYASDIETPLLAVDLITTHAVSAVTAAVSLASIGSAYIGAAQVSGALSAGSVSTASAALSIATIGGAYMASAQVSGALSAGSVSTAAAVVSLATLGATYATSLNIANPLAVGSGGTGLTTIPAGRLLYGNGTSAVATSANLTFSGTVLGVSSPAPAWATFSVVQVGQNYIGSNTTQVNVGSNHYYDGTNYRYTTTAASANYIQFGAHFWYTAPSGTAGDVVTLVERMRLDASGNLGIGTTSPLGKLDARATTGAQIVASYNDSVYTLFTTDSGGDLTVSPTGDGIVLDAVDLRLNQTPAVSAGGAASKYLTITMGDSTVYKIALLANA